VWAARQERRRAGIAAAKAKGKKWGGMGVVYRARQPAPGLASKPPGGT
jgi:hypothetical protein